MKTRSESILAFTTLLALAPLTMGCASDVIFEPTKPQDLYCVQPVCPEMTCHYTWDVSTQALKMCFWDYDTNAWRTDVPPDVAGCNAAASTCPIHADGIVQGVPICTWAVTDSSAPSDACSYDTSTGNVTRDESFDSCQIDWGTPQTPPPCDPVALSGLTYSATCTGDCPEALAASPPSPPTTNVALTIDPARSFLRVGTPLGTTTFTLSGRGWADTVATRTMGGVATAGPGRVAGKEYAQWTLSFENAIQVPAAGGAFRIPAATRPTIAGTGLIDGVPNKLRAVLGHDAVGHLRPAAHTWDLDYADSRAAGTTTLHLEGALASAGGSAH